MSTTPERRPSGTATPAVPSHAPEPEWQAPNEPARDFGWLLTILGISFALLGSWTMFSQDSHADMYATYWVTLCCTAAGVGTAWLRTSLPSAPGVAAVGLSGLLLILAGVLHGDYSTTVTIVMVVGGALILLGGIGQSQRSSS